MKLDIIIPVYNEDENIVRLLKAIEDEVSCNFRVLICYDSETDKTLEFLKKTNSEIICWDDNALVRKNIKKQYLFNSKKKIIV